jgi:hypothetical protein
MTTIQGLLEKVQTVNLRRAVPAIIQQTSFEIEALNKEQLYNYGVNSDGQKLTPYKSKSYAREKNYMNRRPGYGIPDLFLTGAFFQGFVVDVTSTSFSVDSVNSKSAKLKEYYGDSIFGLTKDNRKVYALGVLYTNVQQYITLKTGLIFK